MGGEFGLSLATQFYFSGSALAELEGAESEAPEHLERAVSLYDAGPGPGEQQWFGGYAPAANAGYRRNIRGLVLLAQGQATEVMSVQTDWA